MIKKVISVFLLYLAGLLVFAYAVLPHHHHDKSDICIATSHCDSEHESADHPGTDHKHDTNTDNCVLKQDIIVPSSSIRMQCAVIEFTDNFNQDIALDIRNESNISSPFNKYLKTPLFALLCFRDYECINSGLRAPPSV